MTVVEIVILSETYHFMQIKTKTTVDFPGGIHSVEPRAGQRYLWGLTNIVNGNSIEKILYFYTYSRIKLLIFISQF